MHWDGRLISIFQRASMDRLNTWHLQPIYLVYKY